MGGGLLESGIIAKFDFLVRGGERVGAYSREGYREGVLSELLW